jgi:hypothetical protein
MPQLRPRRRESSASVFTAAETSPLLPAAIMFTAIIRRDLATAIRCLIGARLFIGQDTKS